MRDMLPHTAACVECQATSQYFGQIGNGLLVVADERVDDGPHDRIFHKLGVQRHRRLHMIARRLHCNRCITATNTCTHPAQPPAAA